MKPVFHEVLESIMSFLALAALFALVLYGLGLL